ncbi:hypothetical protein HBI56_128190 [Parastagonospora nodorum]|nr:hypothetical protein HBH53_177130 [Parastagonospora nodorum]KAH3996895.1 hypothetical protein HBI10_150030 [Parastagonospora nodorum]KAH4009106.1 hypothetical protein HBI13_224100 [Parastagonospora nodorum]KAH4353059.1 hypothetical protein HBH98_000470 [Parastagonospora nodorum]KAH4359556.1 hypothetical protein HBH97_210750 [Parastagonospora nodorum]
MIKFALRTDTMVVSRPGQVIVPACTCNVQLLDCHAKVAPRVNSITRVQPIWQRHVRMADASAENGCLPAHYSRLDRNQLQQFPSKN